MTSRDFAFWLQGFFEIATPSSMTAEQVDMVKRHLALVFKHEIDPGMGGTVHQAELNAIHEKKPPTELPPKRFTDPNNVLMRC